MLLGGEAEEEVGREPPTVAANHLEEDPGLDPVEHGHVLVEEDPLPAQGHDAALDAGRERPGGRAHVRTTIDAWRTCRPGPDSVARPAAAARSRPARIPSTRRVSSSDRA